MVREYPYCLDCKLAFDKPDPLQYVYVCVAAGHRLEIRRMWSTDKVAPNDIKIDNRIRTDMGDIDALSNSIREFGIIQPIVLTLPGGSPNVPDGPTLVAGGRRLAAMKRLGWQELEHGVHFIWRGEENEYSRKATELEENLRRKELSWQEQVIAKQQLLELMQQRHGVAEAGGRTRTELQTGVSDGFGVRKLASMLGESPAQTSKDLRIAGALRSLPQLRRADTKESAFRQLNILGAVASMVVHKVNAPAGQQQWTLYEGDFTDHTKKIPDQSVDLVYTDLPFGVDLNKMSKHSGGVIEYSDSRVSALGNLKVLAAEAYRVLRMDRYATFWFGFNYYTELLGVLEEAGFAVNPVPIVWYKHTRSTENPNTRYANAYDPALVAMKGNPVFIRPGSANVVDIPAVAAGEKLQIAQQPVELVKKFILDTTAEGATVVDFTAGSGTTGVAALELKRKAILFEKEPAACTLIRARLGAMK
jgi:DNA modification methylase